MCGRFAQPNLFDMNKYRCVKKIGALDPRFNIAPTSLAVVMRTPPGEKQPIMETLKWGLVRTFPKTFLLSNIRTESVLQKPVYQNLFKKQRCLIPVSGFYEWKQNTKPKQPYYFFMKNKEPFLLAGLWEDRRPPEGGEPVTTFTIITTKENKIMKPVHDRMPVIIDVKNYDAWLDPNYQDIEKLQKLLKPYSPSKMDCYPVSTYVSNSRNEGPDCVKPLSK